jgi:rubrerythrin
MTNLWRCTTCGYIHRGEEPPEICPKCSAPKKRFVPMGPMPGTAKA